MPFVNVAKDVQLRFYLFDYLQQIFTTSLISLSCQISNPVRRTVSDQHIRILRDQFPLGSDLGTAFQVESPVIEPGLPGAAVELDTVDDHFLVLEIRAIGQELLAGFPVILETEVMVAGDDDLVGVGECA